MPRAVVISFDDRVIQVAFTSVPGAVGLLPGVVIHGSRALTGPQVAIPDPLPTRLMDAVLLAVALQDEVASPPVPVHAKLGIKQPPVEASGAEVTVDI